MSYSGEEQERKLFVGGFNKLTTDEDTVKSYFEQNYGNIIDCTILRDNEKVSRGFGFVLFEDAETVDKIMRAKKDGERFSLDGETNMEVKRALPRDSSSKEGRTTDRVRDNKVFVGGLPSSITEDELRQYFEAYGRITQIELLRDRESGRLRGFAFIGFEDEDSADKCIQRRTHEICRKICEVKRSHPTKPRTQRFEGGNRDSGSSVGILKQPQSQPLMQTGNAGGQDMNTLIQQAFLMGQQSVYQQLGLQQPAAATPALNFGVGGMQAFNTLPTQQPTNNILLQALATQQHVAPITAPIVPALAPPVAPLAVAPPVQQNTDTLAQLAQLLQGGFDPSRLGALLKPETTAQRAPIASAPAPSNGYPTSYPGVYSQASSTYGAASKSEEKRGYRPY